MKYNNTFYIQLSREIFKSKYNSLSTSAKWLYCVLNELEHRFAGDDGLFFRTNDELAADAGLSLATLKRAKKELIMSGLIETEQIHFQNRDSGKISKKKVTGFKISKV